jgi:hypothetical protein
VRNLCAEAGSEEALLGCDAVATGRGSQRKRSSVNKPNLPRRKKVRKCDTKSEFEAIEAY